MNSRPYRPSIQGQGQAAPNKPAPSIRLEIERLEDRLVMSSTIFDDSINHLLWSGQSFHLDDAAVTELSGSVDLSTNQASQLIGLDQASAAFAYNGSGYSVAILDTGIDYNNAALGGGWGKRVIAGWDFANNDADPMDDNGHGTHVAGIIGSSDATYKGIAPNVNIIALKVIGADGSGSFGNIEQALQWVVANQAKYNIVAVNMSLGSGNYSADPFLFLNDEFGSLESSGVFIAVASGNSYYSYVSQQGLAFPAVSGSVVSVGAVWAGDFGSVAWLSGARDYTTGADRITSFTQRNANLDIVAPGALITSTYLNNRFVALAGRSMATPMVAGAAVLIHQALDANNQHALANQNGILGIMQKTGATVIDGDDENDNVANTGLSFKRLDINAALKSITPAPAVNSPPVLSTIPDQTLSPGQALTLTLSGTDVDGDALTYQAQVQGSGGSSQAYQLKVQLGLQYGGNYYTNIWGANEKWLVGNNGQWYCLMPNGDLRRWTGTMQSTLLRTNLIASLGTAYYQDPSLLWNATASTPSVTVAVVGNKLTITAPAGASGTYQVNVTVSDGKAQASQTFKVTLGGTPTPTPTPATNRAPTLGAIANVVLPAGQNTTTITLAGQDADNDALTYTASLTGLSKLAVQTKQNLGLATLGFQNLLGLQEKWFQGKGSQFYFLLPSGELRVWTGTLAGSLGAASLVATFDSSFYSDTGKLLNPVSPTFTLNGNKLTISTPAGYKGTFAVQVTVSDGKLTATQTFNVSIGTSTSGTRSYDEGQADSSRSFVISAQTFTELPRSDTPSPTDSQCRDYYFQNYDTEEELQAEVAAPKSASAFVADEWSLWAAENKAMDAEADPFAV